MLKQNTELSKQKIEIETSYKKLNDSYRNTIFALSNAVDARDPYTAGHSARVTKISMLLGKTLDLKEKELGNLEYAALFHDIGKIGIPDCILLKNGKLTDEEFEIIKKHPEMGVHILKSIDFLTEGLPIIKHHHEKFMGYERIRLNDKYQLDLFHIDGYSCVGSCGAAERSLLALSFTLALQEVSGFNSLLFIDISVARVSDLNRINFAN